MRRLEARWDRRQGRPGRVEVAVSAHLPYPLEEVWQLVTNPHSLMLGEHGVSAVLPVPDAPAYPAIGSRLCVIQPTDDLVVAAVVEVTSVDHERHITLEWRSSPNRPQTWHDFVRQATGVRWTIGYRLPCVAGQEREVEAKLKTAIHDEHDRMLRFLATGARLTTWVPATQGDAAPADGHRADPSAAE